VLNSDPIAGRLADVRRRVAEAATRAGRKPDDVRLIAVSKTFPYEDVGRAHATGQLDFGENKVQDGLRKIEQSAGTPIRWHLLGHVQSNKAKGAARFTWVHTIDGADLLRRIDQAAVDADTRPSVLIQVDLAREPTKHGALPDDLASIFDQGAHCRAVSLRGLMVIPPFAENPEETRVYFRQLREVRDALLGRGIPGLWLAELSMGMSHDFDVAIEEGATMVRVGTAIFGHRTKGT